MNRLLSTLGVTALLASPAVAGAATPAGAPGKGKPKTEHNDAPAAAKKGQGRAYGKYCQGESKKRADGEKGTAFSRCVKAMARAAKGDSPKEACKGLSKKHVKGEKGTPYSRCVVAAAKLKADKRDDAGEGDDAPATPAPAPTA